MTIKSLLLGSAAALVAVTGAKAADAPVTMVEPEPVEYVRVCDVYGTGFFYIPGTETCLKIGGYVRVRFQGNNRQYNNDIDDTSPGVGFGDDYTVGTRVRARLDFDAREETELGTLRAKVRFEATNSPTATNSVLEGVDAETGSVSSTSGAGYTAEEAYIQLGGLTMGYLDSAWTADDGGISDGLLVDESDFAAGDFQANRISYTAAFSGFSGTVSVEDDGSGDFIPDVIAKLSYKGGFGGAYIMGVYDEDAIGDTSGNYFAGGAFNSYGNYTLFSDEFDGNDASDGAFVLKAGIQLENLILADSILKIEGHYAFDPSQYAVVGDLFSYTNGGSNNFGRIVDPITGQVIDGDAAGNNPFSLPSEWQIGAAYQQKFGKLFTAVAGIYGQTFDLDFAYAGFSPTLGVVTNAGSAGRADYFGGALDLGYQITSNFSTLAEVSYVNIDMPVGENIDQTRGLLEFKRTF